MSTNGGGSWSNTSRAQSNLAKGTYHYRVTVADLAGNPATSQVLTVVIGGVGAPVVIDLNRDGLLSYSQLAMDVDGDGHLDLSAWAGPGDGVLVWDKHADGKVHDASQYAFTQYGGKTDLEGLSIGFDSNADGVFDAQDERFAEFKVWQDANQNGISDPGEVQSLADWGLSAIQLLSDGVSRQPAPGVTEAGRSSANATDGSLVLVSDAGFEFSRLAYSAETVAGLGQHIDLLGSGMDLDFSSFLGAHGTVDSIDINGSGANALRLDLSALVSQWSADAADGAPDAARLKVQGGSDDTLALLNTEGWRAVGEHSEAGVAYSVWQHALSPQQLLIEQQLQVL